MSQSWDDTDRRPVERRAIADALDQMHLSMREYYMHRHQLAMLNQNPEADEQLRQLFLRFHTDVMHAFSKLRSDIKIELRSQYWETTDFEELRVEAEREDGTVETIGGLQLIDGWYDMTITGGADQYERHRGTVRESVYMADLPHHRVLRQVAQILHEAAKKLGYGATPTPQREDAEFDYSDLLDLDEEEFEHESEGDG